MSPVHFTRLTQRCRSKAWVCGHSLAGIVGSHPAGDMDVFVSVVCCQVEVSASCWSLFQRSPTECGVSECDREASIMRRPWLTRGCCAIGKKKTVRCTNPRRQIAVATTFCTVASNICRSSICNLLRFTLLAPRILRLSTFLLYLCTAGLTPIIHKIEHHIQI
jgi:hypothetical protein